MFLSWARRRPRASVGVDGQVPSVALATPTVTAAVEDRPLVLDEEPGPDQAGSARRPTRTWLALALAVTAGLALRCWTPSNLWLDEALSVNIAKLPLRELPDALRHDGAPPLYYLFLHGWVRLFGSGDVVVRLLSALFSVATLPLMWFAGRRLGSRATAWSAFLFMLASPFAIRYATEARMYSLLMLLSVAGFLALVRALERPSLPRLAVVALVTTALLLTHYWTMYLLALVGALLVARALRQDDRGAVRALVAMGAGLVLFLPWLPTFVFQFLHTGTPWSSRPGVGAVITALEEFGGGRGEVAPISSLLLFLLALIGLFGRALDERRIEIDLRTRPAGRALAFVGVGSLAMGVLVGVIAGAGYAIRYTAMVVPLYVLLATLGTVALADRRVRSGALALVVLTGLWTGARTSLHQRTTAGTVAEKLKETASPGDLIAYCPDQLGPAVSRLLPAGFDQVSFPRGHGPERVDWVDYDEVNRSAQPRPFADMLLQRGAGKNIWVVWSPGYRTFGAKCETIIAALRDRRPVMTRPVRVKLRYAEHPGLVRFSR